MLGLKTVKQGLQELFKRLGLCFMRSKQPQLPVAPVRDADAQHLLSFTTWEDLTVLFTYPKSPGPEVVA